MVNGFEQPTSTGKVEVEDRVLLRYLVVCRLTLFNGRRDEQPVRMLLSEWGDAKKW